MVIVITLLVLKKPSIPVITAGAVIGMIWGVIFQGLTPVQAISTAWTQIPKDTGIVFIDNISPIPITQAGCNLPGCRWSMTPLPGTG